MQALNSSSFELTEKSGAWRFDTACVTESDLVTIIGVLPVTHRVPRHSIFS